MHVILTGATGSIGSRTLHACLASDKVSKLSILSRREFPLPKEDGLDTSKAEIIVHKDYENYPPELCDKLKGAEACIWAQGISQRKVNADEYVRITHDYPIAAAKSFASLSNKFNFVYVSGEGADRKEKTFMYCGKIKGRAEKNLCALPSDPAYSPLRIFNVRPGYVEPPPGSERSLASKVLIDYGLAPIFKVIGPSQISPPKDLAKVLVDIATGDGEPIKPVNGVLKGIEDNGRLVRSAGIRWLASL